MAQQIPRILSVIRTHRLTPNMIRITLGGDALAGFPNDRESGYIKLHFPPAERGLLGLGRRRKPQLRSYTIRAFNSTSLEMDIDFVVHGDNGPASRWALSAKIGDAIPTTGMGAKKMVDMNADWYFIAGDMTALPAISVNLEKMPRDAVGYAVIEVMQEEDRQALDAPAGIDLQWVVNTRPDQPNRVLASAVKSLPWMAGTPNVWVAAEFDTMRELRRYFKQERGVSRDDIYASSYWKMGDTDEGNKLAKSRDKNGAA